MIEFRALGEVAAVVDGEGVALGGARQRRLLAMLLIHRNTVVSADRLADAVFAGEPTDAAATTMRSYIARIRRVVDGRDDRVRVVTQPPGYCLRIPDELFDAATFEAAVAEAGRCLMRGDPEAASAAAGQAIERWTGDPYPEFDDEVWVQPEAQRLQELRLVAADRRFEAELACGRSTDVVSEIERMVREHPVREGFRAQLMLALYRSGRQADALRAFHDYRTFLGEELGLEPSPALAELEGRILAHDPVLANVDGGRTLHGYRLGDRLGTGRDGTLYSARVSGTDREFVLRSFRAEIADEPHFVRAFESDAHGLVSLRHPAIVPLRDYWRGPHEAYLAMPRLTGGTLDDRLRHGRLRRDELVSLVERVGGALTAAADAGLSHGRITGSNILFDEHGLAFVTDFALGVNTSGSPTADLQAFAELLVRCADAGTFDFGDRSVGDVTSMTELVAAALAQLHARPATVVNPYKGLEAFDEVDAADFFGRDDVVDDILKRLHGLDVYSRLVLVVGGSGTGKSSVVRAGLLPRLRAGAAPESDRWLITTCTPSGAPFQQLADALTRVSVDDVIASWQLDRPGATGAVVRHLAGDSEVVVVIDQLEELFTMAEPDTQQRFLDEIVTAVSAADSRLRVVATLRADFFDRPLAVPSIGPLVNGATVTIPAMAPAELEQAIVEPARRVGRDVERSLIAELVGSVAHNAAALPALQFALFELAELGDPTLTLAAYRELGGVSGAVAARAEQLYRNVPGHEQAVIRRLFERMVVVTDGEPTRRRVPIVDVASDADGDVVDAVVERWVVARLLTLDRDPRSRATTVEVAHEAVIREWPRLQRWIAEDRAAIATAARVHDAATAWVESDREPSGLLRGLQLEAALQVAELTSINLSPGERELVEASRVASDEAAAEQATRLAREQRSNRRLRWQLAALGGLLVAALVIGLVAVDQRRSGDRARRVATARELAAAAQANLDVDPERSKLLALAAIDATRAHGDDPLPEALTALHSAVVASRIVERLPGLGGTVAWSPTDDYLVSEGPENSGMIELVDPRSGEPVRSWQSDQSDINDLAFSADGSMLATTGDDGSLRVWDPDSGELRFEHRGASNGAVWGPSFSGDGSTVAASWMDEAVIRVIDVTTAEVIGEYSAEVTACVTLSHDGNRVAFGTDDGSVQVLEVSSGEVALMLEAPTAGATTCLRYSPDGRYIAAGGRDDHVTRIWDATTGSRIGEIGASDSSPRALAWSADSRQLALGTDDGTIEVWTITSGGAQHTVSLTAQDTQNGIQGVTFSPDGSRVASGDVGVASMIVWDVAPLGGGEWANAMTLPAPTGRIVATPDDRVVAADSDGGISAFSMDDGSAQRVVDAPLDEYLRFAVDSGGSVVATARGDRFAPIELWNVATGERIASFRPDDFEDWVTGLAWTPDGQQLAVSGGDGDSSSIVVVDRTGTVLASFREEPGVYLRNSAFSPDGTVLAIPRRPLQQNDTDQQGLWLWDWAAGEMRGRIDTATLAVDWSPSGDRIVTVAELEAIGQVWDVETLDRVTSFTGTSPFAEVRFSPDGSQVATAGVDGDINLWNATDGSPAATLRGHDTRATSLAFASDGRRLASVDDSGVMRVWALDVDDLIAIAKRQLTRELTDVECRQFVHRDTC